MSMFIRVNNRLINADHVVFVEKLHIKGEWLVRFHFSTDYLYDVPMLIEDADLDDITYSELADSMIEWFHENVEEMVECGEV